MPNYIVNSSDLTDIADAIREKGETSALLEFPDDFVNTINAIQSGGVTVTDGVVIKARDTNGYPTEADLYAVDGIVQPYQFMVANNNNTIVNYLYYYMQTLHIKNAITQVEDFAFSGFPVELNDIDFPSLTKIGRYAFTGARAIDNVVLNDSVTFDNNPLFNMSQIKTFECGASTFPNGVLSGCKSLVTVRMPKLRRLGTYVSTYFGNCTALQTCVLGGIGYSVDNWGTDNFKNCTQTGLTITAYAIGDKVDDLVTSIRTGATNATIIIKAASATTYNNTSYAAGDTILTSEVVS